MRLDLRYLMSWTNFRWIPDVYTSQQIESIHGWITMDGSRRGRTDGGTDGSIHRAIDSSLLQSIDRLDRLCR
jgi:hypothetical protein